MSEYIVRGGKPLYGTVRAQGSKNSAVAILMACIAVKGTVLLRRVPYISDVLECIKVLRMLGAEVGWLPQGGLSVDCSEIEYRDIPTEVTKRMRASTYLMGGCLARFGHCGALTAGGCSLGKRPVNLHLDALRAVGATLSADGVLSICTSPEGEYVFPRITVGGTVNAVLASVIGDGVCKEYGTYEELMELKGAFYELRKLQTE